MPSVYRSEDGYSIRGLEPPALRQGEGLAFWSLVVPIALRAKDRDLARGLGANGEPLRPISEETRRHRRSAMTPSGRGDPNAPPLIPGWQKSRTRSLLTGKAYQDHAEFWWKFDARTGDSWARILEHQVIHGRDVFGLGPAAMRRVKAQSWEQWERVKKGKPLAPILRERILPLPKPEYAGKRTLTDLDLMTQDADVLAGRHRGFMSPSQRHRYYRQTAPATLPGRPARPKVMSPISGPEYNRMIAQSYRPTPQVAPEELRGLRAALTWLRGLIQ
jgi:hypothetical protein